MKKSIWVIGIYSQKAETFETLSCTGLVFTRGNLAARWLEEIGWKNFSPLLLPQDQPSAAEYMEEKIDEAKTALESKASLVYVTQAMPLGADAFAAQLCKTFPEAEFHWNNGQDLAANVQTQKIFNGSNGAITILDGLKMAGKYHIPFDPSQAALLYYPDAAVEFGRLSKLLADVYPHGHEVSLLFERADAQLTWNTSTIEELALIHTPVAVLLVPPRAEDASLVSFEDLIAHLRAPEGCPWDKKQTHDSLRSYLLEETYEALDALDQKDMEGLKEELGDILLQITLHAQIATEAHEFNMAEVLEGINRKLVFRHPHVFGEASVDGVSGVLQNWEKLKEKERAAKGQDAEKGLLDGIPQSFPALAQAQAIQDRAARVGFDWNEIEPVIAKVFEEFDEVKTAPNEEERAKELGDLLFAVVNLVRWYKVDAEAALRGTNLKFRRRFSHIEQRSRETGKPLQEMTLDEMDAFWNEAKKLGM